MKDNLMQAIVFETPGDPEVMHLGEVPLPVPGVKQVRIKVVAAGVNRADTLQRRGKYPPPPGASPLLGLEVSGVIDSVGTGCLKWKAGDRVMGLLSGGGYAQYVIMHEDMVMAVPDTLNLVNAAAIPEVFLTAYQSLVWLSHLQARETILIHAGASGVGTAAIQLALAMDAVPIVTASKEKHNLCSQLGARATIDYKSTDFAEEVKRISGGQGVDVIVDFIGGPYFKKNIEILNNDGRIVLLATMGGVKVEGFNLLNLITHRISVMGSTLRARSTEYQSRLTHEFWKYARHLFEDGSLRPVVDKIFTLHEAAMAHRLVEENKTAGKIILRIEE
ncbi:MAG: NAD(P)H-quinone oxidoreductase [Bacteroidota bacterium]|nr:NAD(P)H-quinone oxidoreductase [Bacteroidota bacterium]